MLFIKILLWIIISPILFIIGILTYSHIYRWQSTTEWYEAISVEVDTPTGVKRGRSVGLVGYSFDAPFWGDMAHGGGSERADAVVIEVLPGQYLFALTQFENTIRAHVSQFVFPEFSRERREKNLSDIQWAQRFRDTRGSREMPRKAMPVMVRFRNINDPSSVELVDPYNLAASFGPGVTLKSIKLEMLGPDGAVTHGEVQKVLPCLTTTKACVPLSKSLPHNHPLRNLTNSSFSTGSR